MMLQYLITFVVVIACLAKKMMTCATEHHCRPRASLYASITWLFTITVNLGDVSSHLHFKAKMEVLRYGIDSTLWYGDTSLTGRTLHVLLGPRPLYFLVQTLITERVETWKNSGFFVMLRTKLTCDVWRKWSKTVEENKWNNKSDVKLILFVTCFSYFSFILFCFNFFNTTCTSRCVPHSSQNGSPDVRSSCWHCTRFDGFCVLSCTSAWVMLSPHLEQGFLVPWNSYIASLFLFLIIVVILLEHVIQLIVILLEPIASCPNPFLWYPYCYWWSLDFRCFFSLYWYYILRDWFRNCTTDVIKQYGHSFGSH